MNKEEIQKAENALIFAVEINDLMDVKMLLNSGVNPDAVNSATGRTVLMLAASKGFTEIVNLLLSANAKMDTQTNKTKWTALHFAVEEKRPEVVRVLLLSGANPNLTDANGFRDLHYAMIGGNSEIIRILEEAGAK